MLQATVEEVETLERHFDRLWKVVHAIADFSLQSRQTHAHKGVEPRQHFVKDRARRPHINLGVVRNALMDFRCHVERRAAHRIRHARRLVKFFGHAEVADDDFDFAYERNRFQLRRPLVFAQYLFLGDLWEMQQNISQLDVAM